MTAATVSTYASSSTSCAGPMVSIADGERCIAALSTFSSGAPGAFAARSTVATTNASGAAGATVPASPTVATGSMTAPTAVAAIGRRGDVISALTVRRGGAGSACSAVATAARNHCLAWTSVSALHARGIVGNPDCASVTGEIIARVAIVAVTLPQRLKNRWTEIIGWKRSEGCGTAVTTVAAAKVEAFGRNADAAISAIAGIADEFGMSGYEECSVNEHRATSPTHCSGPAVPPVATAQFGGINIHKWRFDLNRGACSTSKRNPMFVETPACVDRASDGHGMRREERQVGSIGTIRGMCSIGQFDMPEHHNGAGRIESEIA